MWKILILCFIGICSFSPVISEEKPIVIIIPSYNNREWYMINLQIAMRQGYSNYRIIYISDNSDDGTTNGVATFARWVRPSQFKTFSIGSASTDIASLSAAFSNAINTDRKFFTLVQNDTRVGALKNLYLAIHSCDDDEIIVTLDGDDWFPDGEVLKRVNEAYNSGEIWMTHGTMLEYPTRFDGWCQPVPSQYIVNNSVRSFKCPTHLRTFYAWLFKKIELSDLQYEGNFFPVTWDMAMMYPMLEMAAERHAFLPQINYVYNRYSPINDDKVRSQLQREMDHHIRNKKPYQRLFQRT